MIGVVVERGELLAGREAAVVEGGWSLSCLGGGAWEHSWYLVQKSLRWQRPCGWVTQVTILLVVQEMHFALATSDVCRLSQTFEGLVVGQHKHLSTARDRTDKQFCTRDTSA